MIRVDTVSYAFSRSWVIADRISFALDSPRFVGIYGENGCGKTTLLQILAGLIPPDKGRITARITSASETDITRWPLWKRARHGIVYVPQDNRIWSEMTVAEHLAIPMGSLPLAGIAAEAHKKTISLLSNARLVRELSHGQQRFLMLMRALMLSPRVLLADEPMAGLDKELQSFSADMLRRYAQKGMSAVVVEHDRRLLEDLGAETRRMSAGGLHAD